MKHTHDRMTFENLHDRDLSNPFRNYVTFRSYLEWEYAEYDSTYDEWAIVIVELIKHGHDDDHFIGAVSSINEVYTIREIESTDYFDLITLVYRTVQR